MKVTVNWLKNYVDLEGLAAEDLAQGLTMAGLEVEAVLPLGRDLESVVTGKILEVRKHPKADRLTICKVDTGKEVLDLVCGAPNVRPGITVPVALPGCCLPSGMEVREATIRGVFSPGMICSEKELGLSADHSGIMILSDEIPLGASLSQALNLEDILLEVNVTPNRGDCLSHMGIAREVAAIFDRPLKAPDTSAAPEGTVTGEKTSVTILAPDFCPRYVARLIKGVTIGPSPAWLRDRLLAVGIRSINNVVDVTNFVLMELGQPLHAFDFDTLSGGRIVVRKAESGEHLTTLDGQDRPLTSEMLVIADGERGVALAGIMGGLNTEIQDSTQNILLESAFFDPRCIRRTAKKLGLSSEASMRFERGVDIEGVIKAADRAALLIQELAGGEIVPGLIDAYPKPVQILPILIGSKKTSRFLGIEVSCQDLVNISQRLGLTAIVRGEDEIEITPTSFRRDLARPVDLMEEAARIIGYDRIPVTIPNISATSAKEQQLLPLRKRIREILNGLGFDEIISYSFISEASNTATLNSEILETRSCIRIKNPISEDQSVMRTSLIPGLLMTMNRNWAQRNLNLRIFELGNVFLPSAFETLPLERNKLAVLWTGRRNPESHYFKNEGVDFFDIKGVLDRLTEALRVKDCQIRKAAAPVYFNSESYVQIFSSDTLLGGLGELSPQVRSSFDLKETGFILELDLDLLGQRIIDIPRFKPWPRFPEITRDMALILDDHILWKEIEEEVLYLKEPLIEYVELFDYYRGKPIPEGKKNLGVRIHYRSSEKTLSDELVNTIHEKLLKQVLEKFGATLREK
ncbi:MAG: phenylalanine--tRNA ligase subunit beta [Thermodesulfobacteriota bacterium]